MATKAGNKLVGLYFLFSFFLLYFWNKLVGFYLSISGTATKAAYGTASVLTALLRNNDRQIFFKSFNHASWLSWKIFFKLEVAGLISFSNNTT